jgi:hypothetical protein
MCPLVYRFAIRVRPPILCPSSNVYDLQDSVLLTVFEIVAFCNLPVLISIFDDVTENRRMNFRGQLLDNCLSARFLYTETPSFSHFGIDEPEKFARGTSGVMSVEIKFDVPWCLLDS